MNKIIYREIWNKESIYNTHLVINAVSNNYSFEKVNSFIFENQLGDNTKMLRTPNKPLEPIIKRIKEKESYIRKYTIYHLELFVTKRRLVINISFKII